MRFGIVLIILACSYSTILTHTYISEDYVTTHLLKYIKKTQNDGDIADFERLLEIISFPNYISTTTFENYNNPRASLICVTCRSTVSTVMNLYEDGASQNAIIEAAINICKTLNIQPDNVCRGVIELNAQIIWYLLENQPLLAPRSICGVVMQSGDPDACPFSDDRYEWSIDIPEKNFTQTIPPIGNNTTFKVAHISDSHYDPAYEVGGLAECNEPTCCRIGQTEKKSNRWKLIENYDADENYDVHVDREGAIYIDTDYTEKIFPKEAESSIDIEDDGAGFWGDYRDCDSPWWAFEDAVDHIVENHDVDYVYFTGDVIDHGVWETTEEMITRSLNDTFVKLWNNFGEIPIFPVIGNHESQPLNQYAPPSVVDPEVSTAWLYNLLIELWNEWLPSDTKETILTGGYYTVLVKPGFRIIALNSNLCYVNNWWIHLEPNDPSGQFSWLVETLLKAENAGEKVHILSHIPTGGGSYYYVCSREYLRILRRFSDTIVAEFNGHSHKDQFKVYYREDNLEPFGVAWNGGSLTTYSFVNPNYRIYEVDSETSELIDAHTWIYNLTEANLTPESRPRWFKEYSFREHYNVTSMSPNEIDKLIQKMVTTDKNLLLDYNIFRGKSYESFFSCNGNCIKSNLCYMVKTELYNNTKCDQLWEVYNSTQTT